MSQVSVIEALEALEISVPSRVPGHICCPLEGHYDKTPSCYVTNARWHCFGCGMGGDGVDLVRAVTGATWPQAMQFLSGLLGDLHERAPIEAPKPKEPVDLTFVLEMESARGNTIGAQLGASEFTMEKWPHLPLWQLKKWGVRVGPYSLLIPHHHPDGYVCGIKTRTFSGGNKGKKSAVPGSTYPQLYRVVDRPRSHIVWLVEGESDTWTVSQWTPSAVLGLPSGARSIKPEYINELASYSFVHVALDADETGDDASERVCSLLKGRTPTLRVRPDGFNDWTEKRLAMGAL